MKSKLVVFVLLLFLPISISAKYDATFDEAVHKANQYISTFEDNNYYIEKNRNNNKFMFEFDTLIKDDLFVNGGFINLFEYLTAGGTKSYLNKGMSFWTMTKDNDNYIVVDSKYEQGIISKKTSELSGVRITEYIKPNVKIQGNGSYRNPWKFKEIDPTTVLEINPNGGNWKGNTALQTIERNIGTTIDIPIPTREGYSFLGWTRTENYGSINTLTDNAIYKFSSIPYVTDRLTAQWGIVSLTLNPTTVTLMNEPETSIISGNYYREPITCQSSSSSIASCSVKNNILTINPGKEYGIATITIKESRANKTATMSVRSIPGKTVKETIIAAETPKSDAKVDFTKNSTASGDKGLYYTSDPTKYGEDGKKIYYYRGNVENNWVYFGNNYWRIVRTNSEDGVKLIYSGDAKTNTSASIGTSSFILNFMSIYEDGYTGNKYGYNELPQKSSDVKTTVDSWYTNKFISMCPTCQNYLSNTAIYCYDRSEYTLTEQKVVYMNDPNLLLYKYTYGIKNKVNKRPVFSCPNTNQSRYTASSSSGNGYLNYPAALLSFDEAYYSGLAFDSSKATLQTYLMDNARFDSWLLSPWETLATDFNIVSVNRVSQNAKTMVSKEGYLNANVSSSHVRPAISLKACIKVSSGKGTKDSPYTLTNLGC